MDWLKDGDYLVEVCDCCLTAGCFHWQSPCEAAKLGKCASTYRKASELRELALEPAENYTKVKLLQVHGFVQGA